MRGKERTIHWALIALLCGGFAEHCSNAQQVYWADQNLSELKRSGLARPLLTNAPCSYVAFDQLRQQLYVTVSDAHPRLLRCQPDGSELELLLAFDIRHYPRGLAIDPVGGKLYWSSSHGTQASDGKIRRANLDGSGLEDLVTGMIYPFGMALDLASGKMFWIRQEDQKIWRANLDGTQAESFIALGDMSYAFAVAVSPKTSHLFWTDSGNSLIGRANLDGSDVRAIAALDFFSLDAGITVDPVSATVLWGDTINDVIYAAGLNGEMPHVILSEGVDYPSGLAVAEGPAVPPPVLGPIERDVNSIRFRLTGPQLYDYTVEFTDSLSPPQWSDLAHYRAKLGPINVVVTNSLSNAQTRFFRVRQEFCYCRGE